MTGAGPKVQLIIDGDMVLFRAVSAARQLVEWDENVWSDTVDVNGSRSKFKADIDDLIKSCQTAMGGSEVLPVICLTGPDNWRRDILPTYKGGRSAKPPGYRRIQDWVKAQPYHKVCWKDGLEADDMLGILMTRKVKDKDCRRVLWSGDKDLKQIPGLHLVGGKITEVSLADGDHVHAMQTLTGDSTDGYSGLKGCGPVAAEKLLGAVKDAHPGIVWDHILAAYEKAGLTREDMLVQARVAKILRASDWSNEAGVILWEPPVPPVGYKRPEPKPKLKAMKHNKKKDEDTDDAEKPKAATV